MRMSDTIRIAVVYHSAWGHTARVAQAVASGAAEAAVANLRAEVEAFLGKVAA